MSFSDLDLIRSPSFSELFGSPSMAHASASARGTPSQQQVAGGTRIGGGGGSVPGSALMSQSNSLSTLLAAGQQAQQPHSGSGGPPASPYPSIASASSSSSTSTARLPSHLPLPPPPPDFEPPPGSSLWGSGAGEEEEDEKMGGVRSRSNSRLPLLVDEKMGGVRSRSNTAAGAGQGGYEMMLDSSLDGRRSRAMSYSMAGLGPGAHAVAGRSDGLPPHPGALSGGGEPLFNAQESNFLTSFLEGFDWDFQPSLPEGMPAFPAAPGTEGEDASQQQQPSTSSMAQALEGLGSPPKAGGTPTASGAASGGGPYAFISPGSGASAVSRGPPGYRSVSARARAANKIGRTASSSSLNIGGLGANGAMAGVAAAGGAQTAESPAAASDRTGSGTSETVTAAYTPRRESSTQGSVEAMAMAASASSMDTDASAGASRKRRTTEQNRRTGSQGAMVLPDAIHVSHAMAQPPTMAQASLQMQQASGQPGQQQLPNVSMEGMAAAVAASGVMHPMMMMSQYGYPPQHPHAAIMQAAESGNLAGAFPWLPQNSLTMQPASLQLGDAAGGTQEGLEQALARWTEGQRSAAKTRTYDEMINGTGALPAQGQGQAKQQQLQQQQGGERNSSAGAATEGDAGDNSANEPEKRQHHIFSEQRRRTNIREGFKELVELLELGRNFGARGLGLATGAGTGIEDEGLDDRSSGEEDEEGSGLPPRSSKKGAKGRAKKGNAAMRGKGKGRGRGGSAGGGAGSKSAVLFQAVDLLRWLQGRNVLIEQHCERLEAMLPPQAKHPDGTAKLPDAPPPAAQAAQAGGSGGSAMQM